MRTREQTLIAAGGTTGLDLMERAGRGVVDAILHKWPEFAQGAATCAVLCGPGNNGGDGFVVARLLNELGWDLEVFLLGEADALRGDARANFERFDGSVRPLQMFDGQGDLVVDALFGTGLTRALTPDVQTALSKICGRCVAIDMPSGICSDSGAVLGAADRGDVGADLTVTFDSPMLGHMLDAGAQASGQVCVVDIGLGVFEEDDQVVRSATPLLDIAVKSLPAHKFTHGSALVLSGDAGRSGAARLAARAALRIGAGLVTLGVPTSARAEVAAQITALMMLPVDDAGDLERVLHDTRLTAVCLGPGLGVDRARSLVIAALCAEHAPFVVLDADALSVIEDAPEVLFGLLTERCVLTPHFGEFQRLFPDIAAQLTERAHKGPAYSKVDGVRAAAARAGCTVLLKGRDTVIAMPDGKAIVHSASGALAAPWLATAGSGDVLAGTITGLLARGFGMLDAAQSAVWVHAAAARSFGAGLIAEDIAEQYPAVLHNLAEWSGIGG